MNLAGGITSPASVRRRRRISKRGSALLLDSACMGCAYSLKLSDASQSRSEEIICTSPCRRMMLSSEDS